MRRGARDSRELRPAGSLRTSAEAGREEAARAAAAKEAEELSGHASSSQLDRSGSEKAEDAAQDRLENEAEAEGQRPFWPRPRHFLFSALSVVLGVGGIVFWPQLLADYGAAFAVASGVLLLTVHLPLLLLEVGLGQFSSSGPLHVFRHVLPALEAVGWAQLLLSLYYGLVNGFYAATNLYLFVSVVAGNGGSRCLDPARELNIPHSNYCTSGLAFEACRDLGVGREEARWLVGGRCHAADSLSSDYLSGLQDCWARAAEGRPVDQPLCSVSLHLYFNATSPLGFFRLLGSPAGLASALLHPDSPEATGLNTTCFKTLFKEKQRCVSGLKTPPKSLDWGKEMKGRREALLREWEEREMVIDLRHWEEFPQETTAMAICLHRLLSLSDVDLRTCGLTSPFPPAVGPPAAAPPPKTSRHMGRRSRRAVGNMGTLPVLACLLRSYCAATFPSEAGLGDVACVQRVLSPIPSLASNERDRHVASYFGPNPKWSPRLWVGIVMTWPILTILVWGGLRRIGKLSFLLGVLPLFVILGQASVVLFWPELLPGFLWALRLDWCRLLEPGLWVRASAMNFFCLGLGKGVLMTLASYNRFHHDCLRDALLASMASFCACITSGAVMVGYVMVLGDKLSLGPVRLMDTGLNLIELFVQSLEEDVIFFLLMGIANLVFFVLTTLCAVVLAVVTAASDEVEWLRLKWGPLAAAASALAILPSLPLYGHTGGNRWVYRHVFLVESLVTPASQLVLVVLLAYVYGARRLLDDLAMMVDGGAEYQEGSSWGTGRALVRGPGRTWLLGSLALVTPLGLAALTGLAVAEEAWETGLALLGGLALLLASALLYSLLERKISPANLFRARLDWAPALEEHRAGRYSFNVIRSLALLGRAHRDVFFRAGPAAEARLTTAFSLPGDSTTHLPKASQTPSRPPDLDGDRSFRTASPAKAQQPRPARPVSSSRTPLRQPSSSRQPVPRTVRKPRSMTPNDLSLDTSKDTTTNGEGGGARGRDASYDTTTKGQTGPSTSLSTPNTTTGHGQSLDATTSGDSGTEGLGGASAVPTLSPAPSSLPPRVFRPS